jgi:hypothetical protein
MFKRVLYEEWHSTVPIIAFILTFGVFVFFVVRALRLRQDEVARMASMPLDLDEQPMSKEANNA